jgi:leader peptidase (prepilin peptidase)/N-methyltransferase
MTDGPARLFRLLDAAPIALCILYALLGVAGLASSGAPYTIIALSAALGGVLLVLSVIDLRTYRLPDALTLPLAAAGPPLAWANGWGEPLWHIISAIAGYLLLYGVAQLYAKLRGRAGLGLGDAKLLAAAGSWLGLEGLPTVLLWATSSALLAVLAAALLRHPITASTRIPFGPFLALGFWLVWLFGPLA